MKSIIKNNSAMMNPILSFILSLAIIVIMYYMFMPMLWFISNQLIAIGAPAAPILFYMKMAQGGFIIFMVAAFIILLARVYKKTQDTGYEAIYK